MTRKPEDPNPEPPGGRAAERLREFLDKRLPDQGLPPGAGGRHPDEGDPAEPRPPADRPGPKNKG